MINALICPIKNFYEALELVEWKLNDYKGSAYLQFSKMCANVISTFVLTHLIGEKS